VRVDVRLTHRVDGETTKGAQTAIHSRRALADLERVADFLRESEPSAALGTMELIAEALQILENHPLIGRPVEHDLRELVVSRGRSGYRSE